MPDNTGLLADSVENVRKLGLVYLDLSDYKIIYRAFFGLFQAGLEKLENKGFKLVGVENLPPDSLLPRQVRYQPAPYSLGCGSAFH